MGQGKRKTEYLEECQPNFCELYIIWGSIVKARD